MNARCMWAAALIGAAKRPVPGYGSAAWLALPDGSPEKIAAVVIAAELWARDGDDLEERLGLEVALARAEFVAAEDADYAARRDAHRAEWRALPNQVASAQRRTATREAWLRGEVA